MEKGDVLNLSAQFVYEPWPGVTVANTFMILDEVLDALGIGCWFFDPTGRLLWQSSAARASRVEPRQIESIVEGISQLDWKQNRLPEIDTGSLIVRLFPIRNLVSDTQGILAYLPTPDDGLQYCKALNVGVVVFRRQRAIFANSAGLEWFGADIMEMAWDEVSGLPSWDSVMNSEATNWLVAVEAGRKVALHRQGAESVIVECLPPTTLTEGAITLAQAAEIAHEIRNPLTAVSGFIELARRNVTEEETVGWLNRAWAEVNRLERIANTMLLMSRPPMLRQQLISLGVLVDRAWSVIAPVKMMGVTLRLEPTDTVLWVDADAFEQVLINIFKNAVEAMDGQGTVMVEAGDDGHMAWVRVSDNGSGISPEAMRDLFQGNVSAKPNGAGLGLMVVKRLVLAHGGKVSLCSSDKGTVVEMTLPSDGTEKAEDGDSKASPTT